MRVLIANDDGFDAVRIQIRAQCLQQECDVLGATPDHDHSCAGTLLTLTRLVPLIKVENNRYRVDYTQKDCVNLALSGMINSDAYLGISDINHRPNWVTM